ncbi:inorganic diphosphatase [Bifidobacterium aquikefiricola]|uniref:Inorganic pyrophosphatase n=1 Tax=Bifidobacterium aquikefiricola TaxID=3059038 RepID=A0AB39U7N9_9BIFI
MSDTKRLSVLVEIPRGQRNKYEMDHATGRIKLDRTLFTSMGYPADYGYIENTLGEDGDPLDALVLDEVPVFPGCLIDVRPVAMFVMTDEHGPDPKIICVPDDVRYDGVRDLNDISSWKKAEIQHFFSNYKSIEPGKHVDAHMLWSNLTTAQHEIADAFDRASQHHFNS